MPEMRSDDPYEAACAYIDAGMKILVTYGTFDDGSCTCGRANCSSRGKHPLKKFFPSGVHSATDDKVAVRRALKAHPDGHLAVALEGRTVIDIDGPQGEAAVEEFDLPPTLEVRTSRGRHLHFAGEWLDGSFKGTQIDVLTGGSRYVLLPPSIHESGKQYRWRRNRERRAARVPDAVERLKKGAKAKRLEFPSKKIRKGERNDALFRAAAALRRRNLRA